MDNLVTVRAGIQLEKFTLFYMLIEAAVSLAAAVNAHSALLAAFGIDSVIELSSGMILLWRLQVEANHTDQRRIEKAEKRASVLTTIVLFLLCLYVAISSIYGLVAHSRVESSPLGIGISLAAVIIMPFLAFRKKRIANELRSGALADDAIASLTCAYMAGTVLIGLLLNTLFHWYWAENIAALVFLIWLGRETWEAFAEARGI
ncbi:MAG: cation transporter [Chloroflexi bacterium]|nr:cation transporter [Chloroflexota bacterium]